MNYKVKQTTTGAKGYISKSNVEVRVNGKFFKSLKNNDRYDVECYINSVLKSVIKDADYFYVSLRSLDRRYDVELSFKLNGLLCYQTKEFKLPMLNKITDGTIATQTAIVLDMCVKIDSFLTELVNAENTSTIIIKGGDND